MKYCYLVIGMMLHFSSAFAEGVDSWNLNFGIGVEQYRSDYIDQARITGE